MEKKEYIKMLIPAFAIGIIIVILIVVMRNTEGPISVKTVLKYTPENICLAVAVLFSIFCFKKSYSNLTTVSTLSGKWYFVFAVHGTVC